MSKENVHIRVTPLPWEQDTTPHDVPPGSLLYSPAIYFEYYEVSELELGTENFTCRRNIGFDERFAIKLPTDFRPKLDSEETFWGPLLSRLAAKRMELLSPSQIPAFLDYHLEWYSGPVQPVPYPREDFFANLVDAVFPLLQKTLVKQAAEKWMNQKERFSPSLQQNPTEPAINPHPNRIKGKSLTTQQIVLVWRWLCEAIPDHFREPSAANNSGKFKAVADTITRELGLTVNPGTLENKYNKPGTDVDKAAARDWLRKNGFPALANKLEVKHRSAEQSRPATRDRTRD